MSDPIDKAFEPVTWRRGLNDPIARAKAGLPVTPGEITRALQASGDLPGLTREDCSPPFNARTGDYYSRPEESA